MKSDIPRTAAIMANARSGEIKIHFTISPII
jgi:hypothetical protein